MTKVMGKIGAYRVHLRSLRDWKPFLLKESGLPGPRGNLELVRAVAEEETKQPFLEFLSFTPEEAPTGTPHEILPVCGVVGLGRLVAQGQTALLAKLKRYASDPRWRVREGVATGLQLVGDAKMDFLLREMEKWSRGSMLEQRAAAAALCEPRLLVQKKYANKTLRVLDRITAALTRVEHRKSDDFRVLRQALGYCWSVAVVASPATGKRLMEKWLASKDKDVQWIMGENLKKRRLARMDAPWVREKRCLMHFPTRGVLSAK